MDKKAMLEAIIKRYAAGKKSEMANLLGITPQGISTWLKRDMFDVYLVFAKCEGINPKWLLSGEGEMILQEKKESYSEHESIIDNVHEQPANYYKNKEADNKILLDIIQKNNATIQYLNRYIGKLENKVEILIKKLKDANIVDADCTDVFSS